MNTIKHENELVDWVSFSVVCKHTIKENRTRLFIYSAHLSTVNHRSRIRYLSKKNSRILTNFPKLKKFVKIRTKIR